MEEILTLKEAAIYLKISVSELRKIIANKEISYFEVGETGSKRKVKRFRKSDVSNYIANNLICRKE